jgi:hypothetical protein
METTKKRNEPYKQMKKQIRECGSRVSGSGGVRQYIG